jgi:ferredoxin-NADP reductase
MTALQLFAWISVAIFVQLAIFFSYAFWRHWQSYTVLRQTEGANSPPDMSGASDREHAPSVASWQGLRVMRVRKKVLEDAVQQICSFYLEPTDGQTLPDFKPGQFLTFKLDIPKIAGSPNSVAAVTRCYSLSDAPRPDCYRVSIKRAPTPPGTTFAPGQSSNFFHDHVEEGSLLQVRAPSGHFYLERGSHPAVLIGGGIGITPMLSMLNWCAVEQPEREVWLFYGVRDSSEPIMLDHLRVLAERHPNFHLHLCFSNPLAQDVQTSATASVTCHHSRVDVALLRSQLALKPYHFYLCGPTPMLGSLVPALEDWGVPDERIHFEAFGPASVVRKSAKTAAAAPVAQSNSAEPVSVTFAKTGKVVQWKQGMGSLLDFAEANGIPVDSGCRAGSCGTCQTVIRSGEVHYLQTPDADPEPGSCLLCVCTPKTAVTLEA